DVSGSLNRLLISGSVYPICGFDNAVPDSIVQSALRFIYEDDAKIGWRLRVHQSRLESNTRVCRQFLFRVVECLLDCSIRELGINNWSGTALLHVRFAVGFSVLDWRGRSIGDSALRFHYWINCNRDDNGIGDIRDQ